MNMNITVIGEAILDRVVRAGAEEWAAPGGSPLNVAVGLARLGNDVSFISQVGDDEAGGIISASLEDERVTVINERGSRTSRATASIGDDGSASYEFELDWDIALSSRATRETLASAGLIHTGSLGALYEPGSSSVLREITSRAPGAVTSFDPNCRPSITPDRGSIRSRVEQFITVTDVVKASDEDIAWLYPDHGTAEVMEHWIEQGAGLTVVTRGSAGALAMTTSGRLYDVQSVPVKVWDTIGAGDAFMAALIGGLVEVGVVGARGRAVLAGLGGEELLQCLHVAASAAAITCTRRGSQPPTARELLSGLLHD